MDRNGHWTVEFQQFLYDDYAELGWDLYDPNGFHAGFHNVRGHNKDSKITDYIQSVNRPYGDSMPFGVDVTVYEPHNGDMAKVNFEIRKKVTGCDSMPGIPCRPYMTTENRIESDPWRLQTCEQACKDNKKNAPLVSKDMWCQDLNAADWQPMYKGFTGWQRHFKCGWKGFD
ncbi:hypothetical protein J4E90_000902 [Alternaria incomplexa]|uniref:uncharacterized protein n=1 Tax=Alternaria incomplexa TaxID=1187928 RepID=UPI002220218F|nr:uncharacterized protein J4E90_000902 [Alternaria incomplexa]KAI4922471.1 hypothetical protein J4E90_000902 [Alternaria incomplexa]